MRIVVVGATGNVGTALLRRLHAAEEVHQIVGVTRHGPDRAGEPYDGMDWVRCDIGEEGSEHALAGAFAGADAVVHLAWIIRPHRDLDLLRRVNVGGARRVASAAVAAGVPHLVVASSVGAYGSDAEPAPDRRPRDESFPTEGVKTSHYAAQKAEVERILDRLEAEAPQILVTRLRPGLIFQEEAGPEIRDYFLGTLVPRPLLRLLQRGVILLLPWPGAVTAQAVHAEDIAEAYWQVVRRRAGGAYNVAADPPVGADLVATVLGARRVLPLPVAVVRAAAAVTYRLRLQPTDPCWIDMAVRVPVMDTTRIRETVGWVPRRDVVGTLAEIVGALGDQGGLGNADHRSRSPLE